MEQINYEEILKHLPSNKIYKEFKSEISEVDNNFNCDKFESVKTEYKVNCINLCKKVARNLKKIPEEDKLWSYNHRCLHYIYWVYEEIWKLFEKSSPEEDVKAVVNEFRNLQTSLTEDYWILNCNYDFDDEALNGLNNKKDEKYLYDYFVNHEFIKSKNFCNSVENDKYKKYLNGIKGLYNQKKKNCCDKKVSKCPNYFLNCADEFDPNKLLNELDSMEKGGCNGLKDITSETTKNEPDSMEFDQDFMNSFYFTGCRILSNERSSTNNGGMPCNLFRANVNVSRSITADGGNTQQDISDSSSREVQMIISSEYSEIFQPQKSRNQFRVSDPVKKNNMLSEENTDNNVRWNFGKGTLTCQSNASENDDYGLCAYMEELVEEGFFIREKDTGGYKFKKGKNWNPKYLVNIAKTKRRSKSFSSRIRDLGHSHVIKLTNAMQPDILNPNRQMNSGSYEEYNILSNTFVRISTIVALFTPFGSCLGKVKKRKKRFRTNFDLLNTERLPRRFIKRTYRHSYRRRFSVINVEQ
ncbi:PIR Superfamily Protein [Plasmodium malariae]|uniref:PIR Superfamily Protein n=1 Tax=Plasmodium malariae TaxID=5858 RepID=A0A1A8WS22_PLAMA|nr:PIR Superfamily Protein [Plasmodium malariae]